jgi:H+/Cl- antiporter ClcA
VQGLTYIAPAACTVLGLIFFHVAAFGCATFKNEHNHDITVGYFKAGYDGTCGSYQGDNSDLPGVIRFGRFIGVVGSLLIWAVFAVVAAASFFQYPRPELVFSGVAICMVILSLFSLLLLSGKSYNDQLKVGPGGVLAIFSAFIWFGGAVAIVRFMKERPRTPTAPATTNKPIGPGDPTNRIDDDDYESGVAPTARK